MKGSEGFWFLVALELFALQAWYWARTTLSLQDVISEAENFAELLDKGFLSGWTEFVEDWLPRAYAAAVFVVVFLAILKTGFQTRLPTFLIILAMGAVTIWILIYRRPAVDKMVGQSKFFTINKPEDSSHPKNLWQLSHAAKTVLLLSVVGSVLSMAYVSQSPISAGQSFGATAAAFFACAFIIPVGSYLTILTRRVGFPVILTLLIWAGIASNWNDNHLVLPLSKGMIDNRPTLNRAITDWASKNRQNGDQPVPIVIVSTAGGGLRAAFWTTTVLGALQDKCASFTNRTFAISGVSGGSVGAAVFASQMAGSPLDANAGCEGGAVAEGDSLPVQKTGTEVLAQDFLGPTVAAMLFPDLAQRFWPRPDFKSRGNVLADSWVAAWNDNCEPKKSCAGRLGGPFLDVFTRSDKAWRPALFLNATHQESGKRFITSHIRIEQDRFFDAYDSHNVIGADVSLATAALNSARFTFVSPPGRLETAEKKEFRGRVLDGGYFENYGAATAAEILLGLLEADKLPQKIKPIFIQIVSDPDLVVGDYSGDALDQSAPELQKGFLGITEPDDISFYELRSPARGLLKTRSARGVLAAKTLYQLVEFINKKSESDEGRYPHIIDPVFAHFEMCPNEESDKPPLGWAMSEQSQIKIKKMLLPAVDAKCNNEAQFAKVIKALKGG
ncbi:MAG: hypothetical protein GY952_05265 [Rhodobacteraceae bacterium]|nr:hypothetical protein [Paracoccaceae bacterium]